MILKLRLENEFNYAEVTLEGKDISELSPKAAASLDLMQKALYDVLIRERSDGRA